MKTSSSTFNLFFLLLLISFSLHSQEITGYIYHKNKPISNVIISVKNTSTRTISNKKGKFTLKVKKGDIVTFSHIAMQPQKVKVKNFKPLTINLVAMVNKLNEVTLSGKNKKSKKVYKPEVIRTSFGKVNARTAGFTIHSISGETIRHTAVDLPEALVGRFPNYRFTEKGVTLRTRAYAIWDIDGMVFDKFPPYIDPETIESIHVIANPAGLVPYGKRGRGGVIIVNTYRPSIFSKTNKTYPKLAKVSQKNIPLPKNEKELSSQINTLKKSSDSLQLMAFSYKKKGNLPLTLQLNRLQVACFPNDIKSYRDYASSLVASGNTQKAWNIYKTLLLKKTEELDKTTFDIIFHDMEHLYHSYNLKKNIGKDFISKKKTASHYANETRLVFEWTDPNLKNMDVEIINPKNESISIQLGSNTSKNYLIEEVFIDNKLKGKWKLNIFLPNETDIKGYLKVTVYRNWISSKKKRLPEVQLFSLSKLRHSEYRLLDLKI